VAGIDIAMKTEPCKMGPAQLLFLPLILGAAAAGSPVLGRLEARHLASHKLSPASQRLLASLAPATGTTMYTACYTAHKPNPCLSFAEYVCTARQH
jgi:hypothetical protein